MIGLAIRVSIGDKVIFDSTADAKPVAFKLGQRPFQNVLCEGVEQGIKGMKTGGKRRLLVPKSLAPPGVDVPDGADARRRHVEGEGASSFFFCRGGGYFDWFESSAKPHGGRARPEEHAATSAFARSLRRRRPFERGAGAGRGRQIHGLRPDLPATFHPT